MPAEFRWRRSYRQEQRRQSENETWVRVAFSRGHSPASHLATSAPDAVNGNWKGKHTLFERRFYWTLFQILSENGASRRVCVRVCVWTLLAALQLCYPKDNRQLSSAAPMFSCFLENLIHLGCFCRIVLGELLVKNEETLPRVSLAFFSRAYSATNGYTDATISRIISS